MGPEGAALCLDAGANDLGGTLMNESITRAAGGVNGQQLDAADDGRPGRGIGRPPLQRTTLYGRPPLERRGPCRRHENGVARAICASVTC